MSKIMSYKNIFFVLPVILLISCDPITGIRIDNNTGSKILIEYKTIYDTQFFRVYPHNGVSRGSVNFDFVKPGKLGSFSVGIAPVELSDKDRCYVITCVGFNIIGELGLGTIDIIDDVVSAMDTIFLNLDVYLYNDDQKILLYDKSYFLDKENIEIKKIFGKYVCLNIRKQDSR